MSDSDVSRVQKKPERKAKPQKKKRLSTLLWVVVFLVGLTAGGYYYVTSPAGGASEADIAGAVGPVETEGLDLGEVVVNINGNGRGHYLRVNVAIEYPRDKKLAEEIKKKKPLLLDVIITTLRSKTIDEIGPVGSVDVVRNSLLEEINKNLECGKVASVYFTDYLFH